MSRQPDSDAGRVFIGYARVSTRGQDLEQQRAALGAAGCVRIFEEKASGAKRDRPELVRMLDHLRAGDVVTITRLDGITQTDAGIYIHTIFKVIAKNLSAGHEVKITDFGKFSITERAERQGRNPATGETIDIAASKSVKFSAAKALKDRIAAG